jgi:trigger factor
LAQRPFGVEVILRKRFEKAPLLAKPSGRTPIPKVAPPSLAGLRVRAARPSTVTRGVLIRRLGDLLRALGVETIRGEGTAVEADDEILVDLVGYFAGKVAPFSPRSGLWLSDENDDELPGLRARLVGARIGASCALVVRFPADHPVTVLRGRALGYAIDVKGARRVVRPNPEDKAFLASVGAKDLDALFARLAREAVADHAREAEERARRAVVGELGRRIELELPPSIVDDEIRRLWMIAEGRILIEKGVEIALQQAALEVWRKDPTIAGEIESSLRGTVALIALADSLRLRATGAEIEALCRTMAEDLKLAYGEVARIIFEDDAMLARLTEILIRTRALDFAMAHALIDACDPDPPFIPGVAEEPRRSSASKRRGALDLDGRA